MKAIITVGISASGKSTWAKEFIRNRQDWIEINRDEVRWNILGEENWSKWKWKKEKQVSKQIEDTINYAVINELNIVCSDTNLNPKYRNSLINKFESLGYEVEIKEFEVDLDEAIRRDKLRPNSVGHDVIYKQWLQWLEYKGFEKYKSNYLLPHCVIVDVDGTVASMVGVRGPYEWDKVGRDKPIYEVIEMVRGLHEIGYKIVFLSGRDGCCEDKTLNWLKSYFSFPIELYMRSKGDMRKDYVIKKELFDKYVAPKYNVTMVIDDRSQVLERLWGPLGIKTINVGNINERF